MGGPGGMRWRGGGCGRPGASHFPLLPPPFRPVPVPAPGSAGVPMPPVPRPHALPAARRSRGGCGGGVGRGACDRRPVGHARRRGPRAGQGGREAAPHATRQAALPPPPRGRRPASRAPPQQLPHAEGPASASKCVRASQCGDPKARCAARPAADARPDSGPGQACGSPGARRQAAGRLFHPALPAVDEPFARPLCVRVAHLLGRVLHEVRAGRDYGPPHPVV